jgi:hypothetical protein
MPPAYLQQRRHFDGRRGERSALLRCVAEERPEPLTLVTRHKNVRWSYADLARVNAAKRLQLRTSL